MVDLAKWFAVPLVLGLDFLSLFSFFSFEHHHHIRYFTWHAQTFEFFEFLHAPKLCLGTFDH
jgi:hypothetical protein